MAIRWVRIISALVLAAVVLEGARWAVRDCPTGQDTFENCLWEGVRRRLGLYESKVLRAAVLEIAGLVILAGFWLVFRYVWPPNPRGSSGVQIVPVSPER